ncbi:hypothetical protein [Sorangium cellulosum]|nr:hypothetical protein [Sorangium cellulosum]
MESFVAFIPLSNWLRGFDRYAMRYPKALIHESAFPDAFYMLKDGEPFAPGLEARGLRTRAICALQRGGVDDAAKVRAYLERSAEEGFQEVCFKELYISSLSENPWAPSAANQ